MAQQVWVSVGYCVAGGTVIPYLVAMLFLAIVAAMGFGWCYLDRS